MHIVMVGPFGLRVKTTMRIRALPLAKALVRRGHQVTVLLPPWDSPDDSGAAWSEDGVRIEHIRLPPMLPLLSHLLITLRLVRRVLALHPQVVHCFKPKAYAGLVARVLWPLRKLGLARFALVLDSDDWEGAGGWNDLAPYSLAQKRVFAWQERWGLVHNDALTLASHALQTIAWSLGVPPAKTWYVPNGAVEMSQAGPPVPGQQSSPTVLLYTRFFEFQLERVACVFELIHQARPDIQFLVVGKGLYGEETQFMTLCQDAGLDEAVEYAGWVDRQELPLFFARAAVALYPFDDTLINRTKCAAKLRELMVSGVPVVAEAVGENAHLITHRETGLLVFSRDAEAMAAAVLTLLDDAELCQHLARGAQQHIQDALSWDPLAGIVLDAYTMIYREISSK